MRKKAAKKAPEAPQEKSPEAKVTPPAMKEPTSTRCPRKRQKPRLQGEPRCHLAPPPWSAWSNNKGGEMDAERNLRYAEQCERAAEVGIELPETPPWEQADLPAMSEMPAMPADTGAPMPGMDAGGARGQASVANYQAMREHAKARKGSICPRPHCQAIHGRRRAPRPDGTDAQHDPGRAHGGARGKLQAIARAGRRPRPLICPRPRPGSRP